MQISMHIYNKLYNESAHKLLMCECHDSKLCNGLCRFVLMFSLGAGPVPSLLLSEILPSRIRAKAMAVCMAVHWVIVFCISSRYGLLHLLFSSSLWELRYNLLAHIQSLPLDDHFQSIKNYMQKIESSRV